MNCLGDKNDTMSESSCINNKVVNEGVKLVHQTSVMGHISMKQDINHKFHGESDDALDLLYDICRC